jgi:hypothetical protein
MNRFTPIFTLLICFLLIQGLKSQTTEPTDKWDHWLVMGNKVVFGGQDKIKHSHEIQWRANNNLKSLERILYEGVFTYSPNTKWEIVPDLRMSSVPNGIEWRPGFGIIYKIYPGKEEKKYKTQLVNQVKWQADIMDEFKQGVRYMFSYNYMATEKFIISGIAGVFYRWSNDFTGLQFVRTGIGLSYVFNEMHSISFVDAIGFENRGPVTGWTYAHFPMVQLIIRVKKNYKYLPAKYINF